MLVTLILYNREYLMNANIMKNVSGVMRTSLRFVPAITEKETDRGHIPILRHPCHTDTKVPYFTRLPYTRISFLDVVLI